MKAQAFEGLLEKAASEGKKGAGQYFTPRILIQSIVRCMKPDPRAHEDFTICDPACGTGGFLVCAYEWLMAETKGGAIDRDARQADQARHLLTARIWWTAPRRLALMNLYLHGLEPSDQVWRFDLRSPRRPTLRCRAHQSALRHQGRKPGPGPRRLHHRHVEQAAQFHPARHDHPEARRSRRGGRAR